MKSCIILSLAILTSVAHADVISSSTNSGYILGVMIRSDLQVARVVVTCGTKKGSLTFSGKNFQEGLALVNATGKFLQVQASSSERQVTKVSEYSVSNEQELLPGTLICK